MPAPADNATMAAAVAERAELLAEEDRRLAKEVKAFPCDDTWHTAVARARGGAWCPIR